MKQQILSTMISHIRGILERNMTSEELTSVGDLATLSLDDLIRNMLKEAVKMAVLNAPGDSFDNGTLKSYTSDDVMSSVVLPTDLLRLLEIDCKNWKISVTELMEKSSVAYREANNTYQKSIGVPDRPIAVKGWITTDADDDTDTKIAQRVIELYPGAKEVYVYYVPEPEIKTSGSGESTYEYIECDDKLYEAACFYTAYLVAMAQSLGNANGYMNEAMASLMGLSKIVKDHENTEV